MEELRSETVPALSRVPGRRSRLYVFSIVALTVFLVCAGTWPLKVKEFRSASAIQLKVDRSLAANESELKSNLMAALNKLTTDRAIDEAIQTIGRHSSIRSPWLSAVDREQLRERLSVKVLKSSSPLDLRLAVEFRGHGSPDETQLVNHIATNLVTEFSRETLQAEAIQYQDDLRQRLVKLIRDVDSDHQVSIEEINETLAEIDQQLELAKNLCATESIAVRTKLNSQEPPRSELVVQRIFELKREQQKLINEESLNEFHPRMTAIRTELEKLQAELEAFDQQAIQHDEEGTRSSIRNRFTMVSNRRETTDVDLSGFQNIKDQLEKVDTSETANLVGLLSQSLKHSDSQHRQILQKLNESENKNLAANSKVSLHDIRLANVSKPIGGVPTLSQMFWLLVSSLMVGAAVTAVFRPSASSLPFSSTRQITEQTGLPVIGTVPAREEARRPNRSLLQNTIFGVVGICELALILFAVVLVCSAIMKTGFLGSLVENPFHAAAKLFGG